MGRTNFVGRVGGLAVGLGIGSAIATLPWVASADVTDTMTPDVGLAADVASLLPAADAAASTPDFAISYDGMSLLQEGNASATTVAGNFGLAIAHGDGSNAVDNGCSTALRQRHRQHVLRRRRFGHISIANGADSITNVNGDTNFVEATGYDSNASAVLGNSNTVIASGADSQSQVLGGSNDLVTVNGASDLADTGSSHDILTIVGNNDSQAFTQGLHDIALIFGDDSSATAGGGDYNLAAVFGDGSNASAEFGNNNLAVAFGDLLDAEAIGGNMTDIEPSATAASGLAELFGGSVPDGSFFTDLLDGSWLTSLF